MADKHYNKVTKTELFLSCGGAHLVYDSGNPDHAIIDSSNVFFSPLPANERFTYDIDDLPNGTEPDPNKPANNLALAIAAGQLLLQDAVREANAVLNISDGTFTYDLDDDKLRYIGATDGAINLEDDTGAIQTLSAGVATTLKNNWETAWELNQTNKVLKQGWLNGAGNVAGVNTILNNTPFGGLGPV